MTTTTITWIPTSGSQIILNNEVNYYTLVGMLGALSPMYTFVEERFPELYGTYIKSLNVEPRTLTIPLKLVGTTLTDLKEKQENLLVALNPILGQGVLKFQYGSTIRYLDCYYAGGLEGNDSLEMGSITWWKSVVRFYAPTPYFYSDTLETSYTLDAGAGDPFLGDPFFPMSIQESNVLGTSDIDNTGQILSWPIFTLTGPGSSIELVNETSGESLILSGSGGLTLSGGEEVVINTHPGEKTVTKSSNGANYFKYLSIGSIFWSLAPGVNEISIEVSGSTSQTEILLAYESRYIGRP